ncbi:MAG TPA: tetratricopeptide repeat protein [Vitreimonas sp.]|jgi:Flp pilus assembly protein TadD|nr:tetratricopeptide repeat protein [Vitreimonas sp.]
MKTMDVSALALASRELLNRGDPVGAERVLSPVFSQLKLDPSVLHLMGLIKKEQNQLDAAEKHFRAAIAYSLSDGQYYNDLGVVLQARGAFEEAIKVFRAALALIPNASPVHVNLVQCMVARGDLSQAETEARAFISRFPGPEGWTLLSQVQRAMDRPQDALVSAAAALKIAPSMRGLKFNHAMALERVGRSKEALEAYERLAAQELDSPDLALALARALYQENRRADAEKTLEQGVAQFPGVIPLHNHLARIRALRGEGPNATAFMEAEITRRPQDIGLRMACADALHRANQPAKALRVLEEALARAPDAPALLTAYGIVLEELNRVDEGLLALRRALALTRDKRLGQRNLLSTLLRVGEPAEALRIVRGLRETDPDEQYLIACEATALRLLGDPGYRRLYDYERFVRSYDIPAPRGFFTVENFNASLADVLRLQHRHAHLLDQTLEHGTQTNRNLMALDEPNLRAFNNAVDVAVRDYVARLRDDDPVGRRRGDRYRYGSQWSVRLTDGGSQPNHVHDRGWISSTYFAALTPKQSPRDPHAGWLKLGEPNRAPPGCTPEAFVEPKVGTLILFPSFMWHGVIPFEGDERLSLSFDVLPA